LAEWCPTEGAGAGDGGHEEGLPVAGAERGDDSKPTVVGALCFGVSSTLVLAKQRDSFPTLPTAATENFPRLHGSIE
jgi:hypothetical protein